MRRRLLAVPRFSLLQQKEVLFLLSLQKQLAAWGIGKGSRLLIALSGGADSTALTLSLAMLRERMGIELFALSCNHGLRGEEAEADIRFCQELCAWLHIDCSVRNLAVREDGRGLEEAGRSLRYASLEDLRQEKGCDWILTAHHARDLAEDILMRILRGVGWPALGGMPMQDPARHLCRPFLRTPPERLRTFLSSLHVDHCEDSTNSDTAFLRNKIRLQVLPLLRETNPQIEKALLQISSLARIDEQFFDQALDDALAKCPWIREERSIFLPKDLLKALAPALRLRLYLRAVRELTREYGGQARAEALFALEKAVAEGGRARCFEMPGLEVHVAKATVRFSVICSTSP